MKRIVVLGSTGSIGCQTLDVVRAFPDHLKVVGLAAGRNLNLLSQQVTEFNPGHVWCIDPPPGFCASADFTAMEDMVCLPEVDIVMVATTGMAGLVPTMKALQQGKTVALSNKEPIVMAGHLIKQWEADHGGRLHPVDSEPSAIWQCVQGEKQDIRRLIITASGGPFRDLPMEELEAVTPAQALRHPTWEMGRKITIDSATMMNKAFEVIESHWLFGVGWSDIEVVVHPQSTIHSMVEFADGSVKAQLGPPNMRLPIQYSLFYPDRMPNREIPRLPTDTPYSLDFRPLDPSRYPCFGLAIDAARKGGSYPAVLSAADEVAVNAFLEGRIKFTDIYGVVAQVLSDHQDALADNIEDLLAADAWATERATAVAGRIR